VKGIWKKESRTIWCVYEDTEELDQEIPLNQNNILASQKLVWCFEELPKVGGVHQTRATMIARPDIKAKVPGAVMRKVAKNFASKLITMKNQLDKSVEIDAGKRSELVQKMRQLRVTEGQGNSLAPNLKDPEGALKISAWSAMAETFGTLTVEPTRLKRRKTRELLPRGVNEGPLRCLL